MNKIPTLFVRNPENMKLVTREVNPDATLGCLKDTAIPTSQERRIPTSALPFVDGSPVFYAEMYNGAMPTRRG